MWKGDENTRVVMTHTMRCLKKSAQKSVYFIRFALGTLYQHNEAA
jgi:hypothetical protein